MKKLLLLTGLGLVCIAPAQITKNGNSYLMRMKYKAGSTFSYSVVSTLGGLNNKSTNKPVTISLPMIWKVVSVTNGVATVDTTVGPVTMGGESMMQPTKNRIQVDAKGKVIGQAGAGQQVTPALPEKAVRIGQSWSASAPIELPMQGQSKVNATYTFKGLKTVNGKPMVELGVVTTGKAKGKGTMLLFMSDGSLYRSNIQMTLQMSANGTGGTYDVTAIISRK
jgi:hypothetical protein